MRFWVLNGGASSPLGCSACWWMTMNNSCSSKWHNKILRQSPPSLSEGAQGKFADDSHLVGLGTPERQLLTVDQNAVSTLLPFLKLCAAFHVSKRILEHLSLNLDGKWINLCRTVDYPFLSKNICLDFYSKNLKKFIKVKTAYTNNEDRSSFRASCPTPCIEPLVTSFLWCFCYLMLYR